MPKDKITKEPTVEELISSVYEIPKKGLTGGAKLRTRLRNEYPEHEKKFTHKAIKSFLDKQPERQRFGNNTKQGSFIAFRPKQEYQIDLIYIKNHVLNGNKKYGMVCIDAFTKQCHIELMKNKKAKALDSESIVVLGKIFQKMGKPESVFSDEGSEFTSNAMKTYLSGLGVKQIFTTIHATIVERVNRTIKELINVWAVKSNTVTIANILPDILENYNTSKHESLGGQSGLTPNEAEHADPDIVRAYLELKAKPYQERPEIKKGDEVRYKEKPIVIRTKNTGYAKPAWSEDMPAVIKRKEGQYKTDRVVNSRNKVYLRAHIKKIDEVDNKKIDATKYLKGTKEGQLTQTGGLRATGKTRAKAKTTAAEDRKTRPTRSRKPVEHGFFVH